MLHFFKNIKFSLSCTKISQAHNSYHLLSNEKENICIYWPTYINPPKSEKCCKTDEEALLNHWEFCGDSKMIAVPREYADEVLCPPFYASVTKNQIEAY